MFQRPHQILQGRLDIRIALLDQKLSPMFDAASDSRLKA
jgi:hypothetical protein